MDPEVRSAVRRLHAATGMSFQTIHGAIHRRWQVTRTVDVPAQEVLLWLQERETEADASFRAGQERWAFFTQFCEEHAEDDAEE